MSNRDPSPIRTYPVVVRARNVLGDIVTLERIGGGMTRAGESDRYYPTTLWFNRRHTGYERYFDPSIWADAWLGTGPDMQGPWGVVEVLKWHTSRDPLNAAVRGFARGLTPPQEVENA